MKRVQLRPTLLACAVTALASSPALAHHSAALFDFDDLVTLDGTVVKVDWQNPHVYLTIATSDAEGKPEQRDVQAASLSMVKALGLTREMLPIGAHVKVTAAASRSGSNHAVWGQSIKFDDDSVYLLETVAGNTHAPSAPPAQGLAGKWVPSPAAFVTFLQALQTLPLTEEGKKQFASASDPNAPASFCAGEGEAVFLVAGALPNLHVLEIGDKTALLRIDADGRDVVRVVHLDQPSHGADVAPSPFGDSIGRWEGGTLVIDTTALIGFPGMHTVEKLKLTEDRRQLSYELTLDGRMFTKPVTFTVPWDYRPDMQPAGAKCDPQNAGRYLKE